MISKSVWMFLALLWILPGGVAAADGESGAGFRSSALTVAEGGRPGFTTMPPASTGIHFINLVPEARSRTNQILFNGSGVAAGDVDGDGLCDLYFARLCGSNMLYRNLGDWRFEDITASAGVALVDVDGDGDLDLVVN